MDRKELMRHIGSIEQIGGIRDVMLQSGKAKGVRAIEVDTGILRFTVLPDRGMDIAQAFYKGQAISWISKTGITAPQYYEKDGTNWLRGFYGGLLTTCGLKNIGSAYDGQGLHGRIANTPAENVSVTAEWIGEEYVMKITGQMRESVVFGENLVLRRTITAKLFDDQFTVEDTILNQGFREEKIALCYHCNFGYPLVREGAKIVNAPEDVSVIKGPCHGKKEECIPIDYTGDVATVGIENETLGAYITYDRKTLPDFLIWKMEGEGDYTVGLEPRTTRLGGAAIDKNDAYVTLLPFEECATKLHFAVKEMK